MKRDSGKIPHEVAHTAEQNEQEGKIEAKGTEADGEKER